jgi:hypothetical protein
MSKLFAFFDTKAVANLFLLPAACGLGFFVERGLEKSGMCLERGLREFMSSQNSGQDHLARGLQEVTQRMPGDISLHVHAVPAKEEEVS